MIPLDSTRDRSSCWNVAVLLGGHSAEREISLLSGAAVAQALEQGGHSVLLVDPAEQQLSAFPWQEIDVAFLALHGTYGEDGGIQQELDQLGVCYTGSGAAASALAFHKLAAKERFLQCGLTTPDFKVIPSTMKPDSIHEAAAALGYPLVVKPEAQGSSLGVCILDTPESLLTAVTSARTLGELVLLERAVIGQEWTVPVLDDEPLFPIRIGTAHQFFDFDAKYHDKQTRYEVIADPQDVAAARVQQLSLSACQALGCRGISRVDLLMDSAGVPWLLEVNTLPGMTDHSLVPKSAQARGWSMTQLCEEMIRSAQRHDRRSQG